MGILSVLCRSEDPKASPYFDGWRLVSLLMLLPAFGCEPNQSRSPPSPGPTNIAGQSDSPITLAQARRGYTTEISHRVSAQAPVEEPPRGLFDLVQYDSPVGQLAAYLSANPNDGQKHPAIIWITGGDCSTIGASAWEPAPPSNDQSASAYRNAGIIMMFPSLRGGNDSPGSQEGFFGEVDDVVAAADFLGRQDFVDPSRIYLGGHSTGGTLVLLVAECSDRFRAVFSFGPVGDVRGYGSDLFPFQFADPRELELRAPGQWLHSVTNATFVFEGTRRPTNVAALQAMAGESTNPRIFFYPVEGTNHFSVLAPVNELIAAKILVDSDSATATNITISEDELAQAVAR